MVLVSCWIQICSLNSKSKCAQSTCNEQASTNNPNGGFMRLVNQIGTEGLQNTDYYIFKDTGVRVLIEDPYGIQQSNGNQIKNNGQLPNVIGKKKRKKN